MSKAIREKINAKDHQWVKDHYKEVVEATGIGYGLNSSTLMWAAYCGSTEIVKLLVKDLHGKQDKIGFTALHRAAEKGHPDICNILLPYEGDITVNKSGTYNDNYCTALFVAIGQKKVECVKALLPVQAKIRNAKGESCLDLILKKARDENYTKSGEWKQVFDIIVEYCKNNGIEPLNQQNSGTTQGVSANSEQKQIQHDQSKERIQEANKNEEQQLKVKDQLQTSSVVTSAVNDNEQIIATSSIVVTPAPRKEEPPKKQQVPTPNVVAPAVFQDNAVSNFAPPTPTAPAIAVVAVEPTTKVTPAATAILRKSEGGQANKIQTAVIPEAVVTPLPESGSATASLASNILPVNAPVISSGIPDSSAVKQQVDSQILNSSTTSEKKDYLKEAREPTSSATYNLVNSGSCMGSEPCGYNDAQDLAKSSLDNQNQLNYSQSSLRSQPIDALKSLNDFCGSIQKFVCQTARECNEFVHKSVFNYSNVIASTVNERPRFDPVEINDLKTKVNSLYSTVGEIKTEIATVRKDVNTQLEIMYRNMVSIVDKFTSEYQSKDYICECCHSYKGDKMEITVHKTINCPNYVIPCKNAENGCNYADMRYKMAAHQKHECMYRTIECGVCHKEVVFKNYVAHLQSGCKVSEKISI